MDVMSGSSHLYIRALFQVVELMHSLVFAYSANKPNLSR